MRLLLLFAFFTVILTCRASGVVRDSVLYIDSVVKEIHAYEYADRKDIRGIKFSDKGSLRKLGEYAFLGCSSLKEVVLPEGITEIGEGCFRECGSLECIVFPESLVKLPKSVCMWNENLVDVKAGKNTDDIGSHAFAYCGSLERFDFPAGLLHIGSNVFSRCSSLKEVQLPASIKELESYVFSDCVSLRKAVMPSNGSLLGELIFSGCSSLTEIIENSPVVPKFDCNSFPAEPDDSGFYEKCTLHVAPGKEAIYSRAPGWRLFKNIIGK